MFSGKFSGKTVLITGHTGFKGSWLSIWLNELGANVKGLALEPTSLTSHFKITKLENILEHNIANIKNFNEVEKIVNKIKPDFIFHLAAQALVKKSYEDPIDTFSTNVMGTIHILEAIRKLKKDCVAILITSDKVYKNLECCWGYRENDEIGGSDPYSGSKGAAEMAINSYIQSYFSDVDSNIKVGIARAGNVIGGGDWSNDRIVPDIVRAKLANLKIPLRNPNSTRPWQHVLEPLSAYLLMASNMSSIPKLNGQSFNFGPNPENNHSVIDLVKGIANCWDGIEWEDISNEYTGPYESGLLKLNCDKAIHFMNWKPNLNFEETICFTADWYKDFYNNKYENSIDITLSQIKKYVKLAQDRGLSWAI
jgi:CDP-glucose 4,6-dehydratase